MNNFIQEIQSYPLFQNMKPEHLCTLSGHARRVTFEPNHMIFCEGAPASECYLIEEGSVVLEAHIPWDGTSQIQTLAKGDILGWSWMFPPFVWHFGARTLSKTSMILLDAAHLLGHAEAEPKFGYELMKRISQIAIHRLQVTRDQLLAMKFESAPKPVAYIDPR